jgi:hypothetical protein
MQLRIFDPRIVAIDLRFRRSGFAIFEGPKILLDSGTTAIPPTNGNASGNRFSDLLNLASPAAIVVKTERWEYMQAHSRTSSLIDVLRQESEKRSIALRTLDEHALALSFRNLGCSTKAEIAAALTRVFPELDWKLPPKRDIWDSEHFRQSIFDAIALGLAFWQHKTVALADLERQAGHEPFRRPLG